MDPTRIPGVRWTSRWARSARGPERLDTLTRAEQQRLARGNDEDLAASHIVLALAFPGEGGEMFAEIGRALLLGIPVVWIGARRTLSAAREGVLVVDELEIAVQLVEDIAELGLAAPGADEWTRRRIWARFEGSLANDGHRVPCTDNAETR
jgi:hypothetical protein